MKIYQELLTDHYHNPRNKGKIGSPDFSVEELIPSCGDRVGMQGVIEDDCVKVIRFHGSGCIISQAAASLLTEKVLGKKVDIILHLDENDMLSILGVELGPVRLKCALLSLDALQKGLKEYLKKSGSNDVKPPKTCKKT